MKHRYHDFVHPDRGKCEMLGSVARKVIKSGGILLTKVFEGLVGAVRVWMEPCRPADDHGRGTGYGMQGERRTE